ncbi:hypothetical protein BdWA1_001856 [Babesia duncani]|uniref:Uncharacterized protein n=1 Tax=Babesia duncani TaxID=323732 RepID=A0AAD9PKQ7_9APIC|nr:hypothetical protein BdWA1_001856 [Babesia duncani]
MKKTERVSEPLLALDLSIDSPLKSILSGRSNCGIDYRLDGIADHASDVVVKRHKINANSEHRFNKRSCNLGKERETGDAICADVDASISPEISSMLDIWSKSIVDDLRTAPTVDEACRKLRPYLKDFLLFSNRYIPKVEDGKEVEQLRSRLTQYVNEKHFLCNVIKLQHETIKKLQDAQIVAENSAHEHEALKQELKHLKECIASYLSNNDQIVEIPLNHDSNNFRKPPDVY